MVELVFRVYQEGGWQVRRSQPGEREAWEAKLAGIIRHEPEGKVQIVVGPHVYDDETGKLKNAGRVMRGETTIQQSYPAPGVMVETVWTMMFVEYDDDALAESVLKVGPSTGLTFIVTLEPITMAINP